MALDGFDCKASVPDVKWHLIRFVGGAGAVTKVDGTGYGVTVTYVGSGVVNLVWAENPGTFLGFLGTLQASTPGNVDTYVAVADDFDTTTLTLPVTLSEGGTPTDLAASEWLTCLVAFTDTPVPTS